MFSGLSPLVVEDVVDEGERVVVRARTPQDTAVCPVCGASSGRVHGYRWRTVADVPVDGRRVVVRVRVWRLVCPTRGCRHTYVWADGVHPKVRLGQAHSCVLVLPGVRLDGTKELIALARGLARVHRVVGRTAARLPSARHARS